MSYNDVERKSYTEKYLEQGNATYNTTDISSAGFIGQVLLLSSIQMNNDADESVCSGISFKKSNQVY